MIGLNEMPESMDVLPSRGTMSRALVDAEYRNVSGVGLCGTILAPPIVRHRMCLAQSRSRPQCALHDRSEMLTISGKSTNTLRKVSTSTGFIARTCSIFAERTSATFDQLERPRVMHSICRQFHPIAGETT